jgi:hypothetical protein
MEKLYPIIGAFRKTEVFVNRYVLDHVNEVVNDLEKIVFYNVLSVKVSKELRSGQLLVCAKTEQMLFDGFNAACTFLSTIGVLSLDTSEPYSS